MGRIANFLWGTGPVEPAAPTFAVDADSIDPAVFGMTSYTAPTATAARIDRKSAIQVPAVKRSRDLVPGSLGMLPIDLYDADGAVVPMPLLMQPERNVPRGVTFTRSWEDLYLEGIAWWRITEFEWYGYPSHVERLKPTRVAVAEDSTRRCPTGERGCTGQVQVDGKHEHDGNLIRFDSPNDGLLIAGARAIRTCLALESAAYRYADGAPPLDYFTPADGEQGPEEEVVTAILDKWADNRRTRSTGYVDGALKYNVAGWSPEQLQMADARQHAVLEIARAGGIDPEELGVSTTSRTYANQYDRRKAFLDFTLGGFITAIQDRLSMGDISPAGFTARFNLDAFLRTDALTRYQTIAAGLAVGAIAPSEVRPMEGKPAIATGEAPVNRPALAALAAAAFDTAPATTFDVAPAMCLDAPGAQTFEVDVERRTISGLAVPYGKPARSKGQWWQFSQGTLKYSDVSRVKLWVQHDQAQAVGVATKLDDRPDGLYPTFKIARGPEGDRALSMAEDGVLDGLSIGLGQGGQFTRRGEVNHAVAAPLMEISLTPAPSFDDARVHAVAASAVDTTERLTMKCNHCGAVHAEGVVACDPTTLAAFTAPAPALDFSALTDSLTGAVRDGFAALANPQGAIAPREIVGAGGAIEVNEALPYRFDGIAGDHSFSQDIRDAYMSGDNDARQRLDSFMEEAFAVTTTNVGALNPTQNRPELYVPNLSYSRPLFDLVSTGNIDNKTPFTVPKFASASGLVGTHTEGVEPTPGAFTATSQTVSPTPLSGKIEINREVWDQGGSPQADGIIWGEMLNGWFESIEARIATLLATTATAELNLAGVVDVPLQDALTNYYAGLQFVRGGNRFTATAADAKLFPALIAAKDSTGRKLFPVLGPVNAAGQTNAGFDVVGIGQQKIAAAWALGQGANTRSYNFVPSSVWFWTSAPKRFTFEYQVKSIDMAIWGYAGGAILRDSDVKPIDYDTADV